MISLAHKFLFVHIPKTAGNSIQNVLRSYSEDRIVCLAPYQDGVERFEIRSDKFDIHKHSTLQEYHDQLGEEDFKSLFKFTSIRNPWDRMVSFYFSAHRGTVTWDREKFVELIQRTPSIATNVSLCDDPREWYRNVDFFIRYENLNDDFRKVCGIIGVPWEPLPVRNKSERQPYRNYYDEELVELVRNRFAPEISFFGYEFERSNSQPHS